MAHVARPEVVVLGRVRPGHGAVLDRALARHFLSRTGAPGRVARAGWAISTHFLPSPGTTQCQKRRQPPARRPSTATAWSPPNPTKKASAPSVTREFRPHNTTGTGNK